MYKINPDRCRVTLKQGAKNSNQDLRSTLSVDCIEEQKLDLLINFGRNVVSTVEP